MSDDDKQPGGSPGPDERGAEGAGPVASGFAKRLARLLGREPESVLGLGGGEGDGGPGVGPGDAELGDVVPRGTRYRVRRVVGRGGMGSVLEVWDGDLRRRLAMKVLLRHGGAGGGQVDERTLSRFLEEAQVTGQLDHPGVMPVHELGIDDEGRVFFTMRLVRGRELKEIFGLLLEGRGKQEGWTRERALGSLLRVCEAMAYAHSKGVIHRDLKPANIMVGRFGETYVMDWGLARVLGREDTRDVRPRVAKDTSLSIVHTDRREESDSDGSSRLLTMDGDVVGTPSYMAPEQAKGQLEKMGPHSDVYAVGAMLYQLLTGSVPYVPVGASVSAHRILMCVMEGPPKPVGELAPDAPPELLAICERAMEREAERRYANMGEVAEDLRAFLEGRVVSAYETGALAEFKKWIERNRLTAAAAAVAVVAVIGGLAWGWSAQKDRNATLLSARLAAEEAAQSALRQSYSANLAAAQAALARNDTISARRHLGDCPGELRGWEWHHLRGQTDESLGSIELGKGLRALAAGGRFAVTWEEEEGLGLFDTLVEDGAGEALHGWTWPGHKPSLLAISPGGQLVATAAGLGQLAVWDSTGRQLWAHESGSGIYRRLLFSGDGSRLLVHGAARAVSFDARSGKLLGDFSVLGSQRLAMSADGRYVVSGQNGLALVRDLESMEVVHQLGSSGKALLPGAATSTATLGIRTPMALSPDGTRLATAYGIGGLWVWALESKTPEMTFHGHEGAIECLAFSPDGQTLASGSADQTLRLWDLASRATGQVQRGHYAPVESVAFRSGGQGLASVDTEGRLLLWHRDVEGERRDIPLEGMRAARIAIHPDSRRLAMIDKSLAVAHGFDLLLEEGTHRYLSRAGAFTNLAFNPEGSRLATATYGSSRAGRALVGQDSLIWNTDTCILERRMTGGSLPYWGNPWSADGGLIVTADRLGAGGGAEATGAGSDDGNQELSRLVLREAEAGSRLRELSREGYWTCADFSPDGKLLACTRENMGLDFRAGAAEGRTYQIVVMDVASGTERFASESSPGQGRLDWLPDGTALCVLDERGLRLIDPFDGRLRTSFEETPFPSKAFALHPDGKRVAACGDSNTVTLWETEHGRIIANLPLPQGNAKDIAFTPDGAQLVVASRPYGLHLWGREEPGVQHLRRRSARDTWDRCATIVEQLFDEYVTPDEVISVLEGGAPGAAATDGVLVPAFEAAGGVAEAAVPVTWGAAGAGMEEEELAEAAAPVTLGAAGAGMNEEELAVARRLVLARSSDFDEREPLLLARLRSPERGALGREQTLRWAEVAALHSPGGKNRLRVLAAARLRTGDFGGALAAFERHYAGRERLRFGVLGTWGGFVYSAAGAAGLRLREHDSGALGALLGDQSGGRSGTIVASARLAAGDLLTISAGRDVQRWPAAGLGGAVGSMDPLPLYRWSGRSSDSIALSRDGSRLVTGGSGGVAVVRNGLSGEELIRLGARGSRITALAISGDGTRVASLQSGGQLRLWDAEDGHVILERELERVVVLDMALNADGTRLALMRRQQTGNYLVAGAVVSLWDVDGDRSLVLGAPQGRSTSSGADGTPHTPRSWNEAPGTAGALYFGEGGTLAVGCTDVALFDGKSGAHLRTLPLGARARMENDSREAGSPPTTGDVSAPEIQALELASDHILVACTDRSVRRLDLPGGEQRFSSSEPLNLSVAGLDDLAFYTLALIEVGYLGRASEALAELKARLARSERVLARMENGAELLEEVMGRAAAAGL